MGVYVGSPTKDGRKFYFRVRYKDIFGNNHEYTSKMYAQKSEAKLEEATFLLNAEAKKVSVNSVTLDSVFKEYIYDKEKRVKQSTIVKDIKVFKYLDPIKNHKINDIDLPLYRKWYNHIGSLDLSVATKNKTLQLFKRLIAFSSRYYNTSDTILKYVDNFKDLGFKKEMDFYTLDEFNQFINVIDDTEWKLFFELLYYLGLRQGELQALKWSDIDFKNKKVSINKTLTTKIKGQGVVITPPKTKNSIRILPLTKLLLNSLKTWYNEVSKKVGFTNERYVCGFVDPFKESTIKAHKDKYCELAQLRQIRIHDFRHSCASLLINKGASITLVSKWLGHANIKITLETYTHLYKSELEDIVNVLDNL